MKKLFAFLSAFIVFGCTSDDSGESAMLPGLDYYKFSSADNASLLNSSLNKGRTIDFKNESGQTVSYKVVSKSKWRSADVSGTFSGGGITNFYFDEQNISLKAVGFEENEDSGMHLRVYKSSASGLTAEINFDRWNDGGYQAKEQFVINVSNLQTLAANGKTFSKVIVIDSFSDASSQGDGFPQNAFKLYYDLNYGIVGFDDVDGNEWRLD